MKIAALSPPCWTSPGLAPGFFLAEPLYIIPVATDRGTTQQVQHTNAKGNQLTFFARHGLALGLALTLGPSLALAQSDTRHPLADQIETLSLDKEPEPTTGEGVGWVLYPPLDAGWRQIVVDNCTLILQTFDANDTLQRSIPINLVTATLRSNQDGLLYEHNQLFDPSELLQSNLTPIGFLGLLHFAPQYNAPVRGQIRATSLDGEAPPMIDRLFFDPHYEMWHEPSEDTVAALAAAIVTYQQQACQPLG